MSFSAPMSLPIWAMHLLFSSRQLDSSLAWPARAGAEVVARTSNDDTTSEAMNHTRQRILRTSQEPAQYSKECYVSAADALTPDQDDLGPDRARLLRPRRDVRWRG